MSYKNLLKPAPAPGKAWQSFYFQERRIQQLTGGETENTGSQHFSASLG
jgi:hypothetical protein